MRILALETATSSCTVAVVDGGRLLVELTLQVARSHSNRLMPLVAQAIAESGLTRHDIDAIAVGVGPGSFTGLRIGLATAQGLAWALGKPCVGVSTLRAMAYGTGAQVGLVVPMLDAKRGDVYAGIYAAGGRDPSTWAEVMEPTHISMGRLTEQIAALRTGLRHTWQFVTLCGDVAGLALSELMLGEVALLAPVGALLPRAWAVAEVAGAMMSNGQGASSGRPEPIYLRKSEAETLWESRKLPSSR